MISLKHNHWPIWPMTDHCGFFYHSLAFKFRSPKPSFKHSIQLQLYLGFFKYLIHKLVDYTEARQGPKRINIWHYMFKVCCSDLITAYTKHPLNFKLVIYNYISELCHRYSQTTQLLDRQIFIVLTRGSILEFIIEIFNFCQNLKSWISLLNILLKIISATKLGYSSSTKKGRFSYESFFILLKK